MVTKGLLVRLHAAHGKRGQLEEFLRSAAPLIERETDTLAWFAVQFGRHDFGIFDAFPDEEARQAHLAGSVARGLEAQAQLLLDEPPELQQVDILAAKLPATRPAVHNSRGLLLTFKAKPDNLGAVAEFLRAGRGLVEDELETVAWFALRMADGNYGIFDVFPDNGGRLKHLTGRVPQALLANGIELLGGLPEIELCSVLAEKVGQSAAVPLVLTAAG
jgi:hypothetical protein